MAVQVFLRLAENSSSPGRPSARVAFFADLLPFLIVAVSILYCFAQPLSVCELRPHTRLSVSSVSQRR